MSANEFMSGRDRALRSTPASADDYSTISDYTQSLHSRLSEHQSVTHIGRVVSAVGTTLKVSGLPVSIGQRCCIGNSSGLLLEAEVVGFDQRLAILFPLGELRGITLGAEVTVTGSLATVGVSQQLLGRVLDGYGQPLDALPIPAHEFKQALHGSAPNPLARQRVTEPLSTGIKVIDTLLTVGKGQRLGIFAPAGAGKSTLLGMLAGTNGIDVIVVALIGERGREVREFIEDTLDDKMRGSTVFVVATSDRPAMERINAAYTATALAEGFAQQGMSVLLLLDSVTRYARAIREVGLAAGETPVRQGFTPSVFAELPRLMERTGATTFGSITAFYTVLTDDELANDPVAEETRSLLDGHIVLSRTLAERGHFPAVDVAASISRLFPSIVDHAHAMLARRVRSLLAKYEEVEFLVQVGEYESGSDALADLAIGVIEPLNNWLCQSQGESCTRASAIEQLRSIVEGDAS